MLRINQIKLRPDHSAQDMKQAVYKALRLAPADQCEYEIAKRSIDARHKPDILYSYSVDIKSVTTAQGHLNDHQIIHRSHNKNVVEAKVIQYKFPVTFETVKMQQGSRQQSKIQQGNMLQSKILSEVQRPVVIGFGPAGIFAALKLAEAGLCPIVYERGQSVEERQKSVDMYWTGGTLNTESNVQFGEGGAGTFSDGKLNTGVKDPSGRIREVLSTFVTYGADSSILYVNKPHIGTDVLSQVVANIRKHIIELGGEIHFYSKMEKLIKENGKISGIEIRDLTTNQTYVHSCENICLSIGHSARDTFEMLNEMKCEMIPKAFAVGVRMEHPQEMINFNAYGNATYKLPTADYKVTYQTGGGRGVYSFCMCPGGYVVNASSEPGQIAVNGMSYAKRDSNNANSAIIVTVTPDDFGHGVLDGVAFQRELERCAYREGNGKVPVQLYGDFRQNKVSTGFGGLEPCIRGQYQFADLNQVLPEYIATSIKDGVEGFAKHLKGFDREDAILSGVESRTSSPIRMIRNEQLESELSGLFPCGEGAGYAGGITSAAVDGIKVAEQISVKIYNKLS